MRKSGGKFRRIKRWVKSIRLPRGLKLSSYTSVLTSPIHLLLTANETQRSRDLLLGIPALTSVAATLLLLGAGQATEARLSQRYFDKATNAYREQRFDEAELLLKRILQRGDAKLNEAQYLMAELLNDIGQTERAAHLFTILAPDDRKGNPAAHRRVAVRLSESVEPEDIKRLHWHLTAADGQTTAPMQMAWGRYSLLIGDFPQAKDYFKNAAEDLPQLWQALGEIELRLGQPDKAQSSFEKANRYLATTLNTMPTDNQVRINHAIVLSKLGRLVEAGQVLKDGQVIQPDGPWPNLLANLTVNLHDLKATKGESISVLLGYLRYALEQDPEHQIALKRLMGYAKADVSGNGKLRTILESVIGDAMQPALAHLAMGNLCWLEDDQENAMFHFEQAISQRDDMAVTLNNLAWMVAHEDQNPDPDRALALINTALEQRPEDPRFLDTKGTILLIKEDWKSAITFLEKALSKTTGIEKKAIHKKLAAAYDALGMTGLADQHRLRMK